MITNNDDTTLEVVSDAKGGTAWRECGPGGCTVSRQRSRSGEGRNDARVPSNTAAITTTPAHALAPGEVVTMTGPGTAFNGTFVVVTGDTLQPLAKGVKRTETVLAGLAAAASFVATALRWALPIQWGRRVKQVAQDQPQEERSDV